MKNKIPYNHPFNLISSFKKINLQSQFTIGIPNRSQPLMGWEAYSKWQNEMLPTVQHYFDRYL